MTGGELNSGGHRRSIRLRGYVYSSRGIYFVTICTEKKVCLFGQVVDNEMKVNEAGRIVEKVWNSIPDRFPNVQVDSFVVMPNHVHGVIAIMSDGRQGAASGARTNAEAGGVLKGAASSARTSAETTEGAVSGARANASPSLGKILRAFKSISAIEVNKEFGCEGRAVWQRNYFEHIVRDGDDLDRVRRYIVENPWHWAEDEENPEK
jgi:putative transposase